MKRLMLIFSLFITVMTYIDCQVTMDTMKIISAEVNRLEFNYNLHYHLAYAQQNKRVAKFNGKIKTEIRYYDDGSKIEFNYNENKNLTSKKIYKNDTLARAYFYSYDQYGRLKSERGVNQIDYEAIEEDLIFGLNIAQKKPLYYRTNDTMFILDKGSKYEVRRKMDTPNEIDEEYKFKYNANKDLESIQIYQNGVRYGQIRNKFNKNNLIVEHQFFHSFSSFANERDWASNFRNTVHTFTYNSQGFWSDITKESYNAQSRKWEKSSKSYKYKFDIIEKGYRIVKKKINTDEQLEYIIELDDQFNWISQLTKKNNQNFIKSREIVYYK